MRIVFAKPAIYMMPFVIFPLLKYFYQNMCIHNKYLRTFVANNQQ